MRIAHILFIVSGILWVSACTAGNEEYIRKLAEATASSSVTLVEAVRLAETETAGVPVNGALLVSQDPVFRVGSVAEARLSDVRIDPATGDVMSVTPKSSFSDSLCDGISLADALTVAEGRAGGVAVASVPDDDVACAREIQVLDGHTLWEVKVASDGRVLEFEESDEDGSGED